MKKSNDEGRDFLFFPFTPKPVISSHVSFRDKLRPSAADLHATRFPRECALFRKIRACFLEKTLVNCECSPHLILFYVTGCLFRLQLLGQVDCTVYSYTPILTLLDVNLSPFTHLLLLAVVVVPL